MIMNSKIQSHHQQRTAYVYLRQSTMYQVMHNQESTERQYALNQKAIDYGWSPSLVQILDGDLGRSGSNTAGREDFKTLVAEVSMGKVGAIFVLEASRLSRSSADWNRLLELCSLTQTLIVDQDGCYDPAQFNDQLLLGLKGTMSQAELHLIKARLYGAKINKAKKGELKFPLPVGYVHDDLGNVVFDPDAQVCHVIQMVFDIYAEKQSAYAVVQHFGRNSIKFPKRSYGGRWKGKLIWGRVTYERVLSVLSNPFYAGVYTWGRYKSFKIINPQGEIVTKQRLLPMEEWPVMIKDHHCTYISFQDFENNRQQSQLNKTNSLTNPLSGPPREGLTLLQGLLYCGICGRRMTIRYTANKQCVPTYECNWRKRQGLTHASCFSFKAIVADPIIEKRVVDILTPSNVSIAINALKQIEKRNTSMNRQCEMNIQRCQYQADLAQRRFEQVDPANRLVAASLEKNWNQELEKLAAAEKECQDYLARQEKEFPAARKKEIISLAASIPDLWSKTTDIKDKKRIIRLLISDITVTRDTDKKKLMLNLRWQTGQLQQFSVDLPPSAPDKTRYPKKMVDQVRELTLLHGDDNKTAEALNSQRILSATGKPFTKVMIKWIRHKHKIEKPLIREEHEFTVPEVREMFSVSKHMVYYWVERKYVQIRRTENGILIEINPARKIELRQMMDNSCKKNCRLGNA
jgi:DNA invertase Pin-like site-specific DNA recombinase